MMLQRVDIILLSPKDWILYGLKRNLSRTSFLLYTSLNLAGVKLKNLELNIISPMTMPSAKTSCFSEN